MANDIKQSPPRSAAPARGKSPGNPAPAKAPAGSATARAAAPPPARSANSTAANQASNASSQAPSAAPARDRVSLSQQAQPSQPAAEGSKTRPQTEALTRGLADNFAPPEAPSPTNPPQDPEAARRARNEQTLATLDQYSDFTNGKDDITSREDYQKIAAGQENADFARHLRESHPDWSQSQIDAEVQKLQSSSQAFLADQELFNSTDTAHKGGQGDGKISSDDLVAARLKNDISKTSPPQLSVDETIRLHEKDPGLGNQAITNKYYHQAQELNELLGGDQNNFLASWPAYATHASNSAGAYIRDDGVPGLDQIQDAVAAGNRKVFQDIAPHYDAYIQTFSQNPGASFDDWMKTQNFEGKPHLAESFRFLDMARTTEDPDRKQEYLLASNALAGYHEQQRLDPNIDKATAPFTGSGLERGILSAIANEDPSLQLPSGKGSGPLTSLDTSQKIQPPGGVNPAFQTIDDPQVRQALQTALGNPQADVSGGQALLDQTGTQDWSKLDDRMRTIVGLMVAGQNDPRIAEYPFDYQLPPSPTTLDHLKAVGETLLGHLPDLSPLPGPF